jgi:CRISPR-associated exonuclease Cas4
MYNFLAFLLFVLALFLIYVSRRQRQQLGLPQGTLLYEDMDSDGRLRKPLFDPVLNLVGRPDYLIREGDHLVPVEVKSGRSPKQPYDSHIYQLAAYCLLVARAYGQRPSHGLIRYPQRSFKVNFTEELETKLLSLLEEIKAKRGSLDVSRSHQQAARCRACGYLQICDQSL